MAKINLLPWRQAYREEKKREFVSILVGVALLSGVVAFVWYSTVVDAIENQNERNSLLQGEIAMLEAQVKEIADIKKKREDLVAQIKVIQDLEGTRPVIVRHFDNFVRTIPQPVTKNKSDTKNLGDTISDEDLDLANQEDFFGVYIKSMSKKDNVITLDGVAESYNRVSAFMRNLDESEWFADAKLFSVTAAPGEGEQANSFLMTITTTQPELALESTSPASGVKK